MRRNTTVRAKKNLKDRTNSISSPTSPRKKKRTISESEISIDSLDSITFNRSESITRSADRKKRTRKTEHVEQSIDLSLQAKKRSRNVITTTDSDSITKSEVRYNRRNTRDAIEGMNELEKLHVFMGKYRRKSDDKNSPFTHTCMGDPYGSYNIPDDMYKRFLKLYEDAVVAGYEPYITEKHKEFGPVVVDIDFVQPENKPDRYYTDKTIINVVKIYNRTIRRYLDVTSKELVAYVTEKEAPNARNKEYHDGFHIVYPYICTRPVIQMMIRDEVVALIEKNKIFQHIPHNNEVDKIIDKNVIYNAGWLLYGSRKSQSRKAYRVTHIFQTKTTPNKKDMLYDIIPQRVDLSSRSYIRHFIDVLRVRRFNRDTDITLFNESVDVEKLQKLNTKIRERISTKRDEGKSADELLGAEVKLLNIAEEAHLIEAQRLVDMFSEKRATDWYSWFQVGSCLFNIDYRLLDTWIKFSKKCPNKFKPGECEKIWKRMRSNNYGMASLHYFARQDSPEVYQKFTESGMKRLVRDALEGSHTTVANLLMHMHRLRFKCASIKHNIWYEFKNHKWVMIDSAHSLRRLISTDIRNELLKYQRNYLATEEVNARNKREADEFDDYDEAKRQKEQADKGVQISKVIRKLNDSTFKNGVIRECADIVKDENFLKNLDENHFLICFDNGVYDLGTGVFRDGFPDDCISLSTGYRYIEYDETDEYSQEIEDFFNKIQPDPVMREYLITLMSTCLSGSISEECFYVFTGSGANGKSKLMELMKNTLGDYYKPMDIRLLTEKRSSSSSASPELADKKGVRACSFDEPKATDEINTGFMKIFTGGDEITARALFKDPIYFKPQFKPFLLCNNTPRIHADDEGTWRRLKVVPFLSKFKKRGEASKKELKNGLSGKNFFWADDRLSEKLPDWKQMFMGRLLKIYPTFREKGLTHPKLVTQYTDAYRKKCDIFQDFMGDYLDKTGNVTDTLTLVSLHKNLRNWHKINSDGRVPNIKEMREYMRQRIQEFNETTDCLTCYQIKKFNDGMEDNLDILD